MKDYNGMSGVSLNALNKWLDRNLKYTWFLGEGSGWGTGTPKIKYFDFKLDTRTMLVYGIICEIDGKKHEFFTSNQSLNKTIQENQFKTILNYLDFEIARAK